MKTGEASTAAIAIGHADTVITLKSFTTGRDFIAAWVT